MCDVTSPDWVARDTADFTNAKALFLLVVRSALDIGDLRRPGRRYPIKSAMGSRIKNGLGKHHLEITKFTQPQVIERKLH